MTKEATLRNEKEFVLFLLNYDQRLSKNNLKMFSLSITDQVFKVPVFMINPDIVFA